MNAKIPEVKIHIEGQIHTFAKWNDDNEKMMDAGHLSAQQDRFRRLWQSFIFIERSLYEKFSPEMKEFIEIYIKEMIFDLGSFHLTRDETAYKLAKQAATISDCLYFDEEVLPLKKAAQSQKPNETFPFGAPPLSIFFAKT